MPLFEFHRGSGEYWFAAGADDDASTTRGQDLMKRFLALASSWHSLWRTDAGFPSLSHCCSSGCCCNLLGHLLNLEI